MNRIDRVFDAARAEGRAVLIPFLTGGDPDVATTERLVLALAEAGADAIEIGFPHSDPIGEGPTIQAASFRSLSQGTSLPQILEVCRRVRAVSDVPLVLMGYVNNVLGYGEERVARDCAEVGVDGLIVADTPFEEVEDLRAACEKRGVHRVLMVTPTSTPERLIRVAERSRGWVYCVSVIGVTGARSELPTDLGALVSRIRRVTETPVCVGFGISTPEQAARVARIADGVIVGSALVERIGAAADPDAAVEAARAFVAELSQAVRKARR